MDAINSKLTFNISAAGKNSVIRFGDLTGNGVMDILLVSPNSVSDERYYSHRAISATAFSADGNLLWQIGDPEFPSPNVKCDLPVQIYDIDHDGKNEVIIIIDNELLILDGKTAETKRSIPLPDDSACDCIVIADLDGTGYPQNIILKNKYSKMWAYDASFNLIWEFEGNIGHTPLPCDINLDGKDEIISGGVVLNHDGSLLWSIRPMPKHPNSVCPIYISSDLTPIIIFCGRTTMAYNSDGELLWEVPEKTRCVSPGSFQSFLKSTQILFLDSLSLFDIQGNFLQQKNETVFSPTVVFGFDKPNEPYIVGHEKDSIVTTIYDGYMRGLYTLQAVGKIASCDIMGNGTVQIIIYNDETLDIYSLYDIDFSMPLRPYTRNQPKQYYNASSYNLLPYSQFSSGYIPENFASQNILKWAETYANINLYNSYVKVTRKEFVMLLVTILNLNEDFTENFSDISSEQPCYAAIGTAKALGIIDSEDGLFHPDDLVNVTYANFVLDKLNIPEKFLFDANYQLSKQDVAQLILKISKMN